MARMMSCRRTRSAAELPTCCVGVSSQPVSIGIAADGAFQFYQSGILDNNTAGNNTAFDNCDDVSCAFWGFFLRGHGGVGVLDSTYCIPP